MITDSLATACGLTTYPILGGSNCRIQVQSPKQDKLHQPIQPQKLVDGPGARLTGYRVVAPMEGESDNS